MPMYRMQTWPRHPWVSIAIQSRLLPVVAPCDAKTRWCCCCHLVWCLLAGLEALVLLIQLPQHLPLLLMQPELSSLLETYLRPIHEQTQPKKYTETLYNS